MASKKSEEYLNENIIKMKDSNHQFKDYGINSHEVVFYRKAHRAISIAENEMKEKAIHAFKENCQRTKDSEGCECCLCVRWVAGHCELLDGFIEKLNS